MNEQSNQLRAIKRQISEIPADLWENQMKQNLDIICDTLIDIYDNYNQVDLKIFRQKFERVLDTFVAIIEYKQTELKEFQNFIEPRLQEAKRLRKDGNSEQIIWTGVNCVVNGVGLAALFVPGFNIPIITFGIVGSIFGIWGRTRSEKRINKKFSSIMKEIEENKSYTLISFSSLLKTKEQEFITRRDELISSFGYEMNQANTVVMLEMIINCMLSFRLIKRTTPSITHEVTANIISKLANSVTVFFNKYGKNAFNLVDDAFEMSANTLKVAATGVVIITFAINLYQLYSGTIDREERVEKIENMYKMLAGGNDSLQFFMNKLHQMQLLISRQSRNQLEEQLEVMGRQLQQHQHMFRCLIQHLQLNDEFPREVEGETSLPSITFAEQQNDNSTE